ncbi:MAG: hypothetical protein ACRC9E_07480, partial [Plesiomonas shigelloides]
CDRCSHGWFGYHADEPVKREALRKAKLAAKRREVKDKARKIKQETSGLLFCIVGHGLSMDNSARLRR